MPGENDGERESRFSTRKEKQALKTIETKTRISRGSSRDSYFASEIILSFLSFSLDYVNYGFRPFSWENFAFSRRKNEAQVFERCSRVSRRMFHSLLAASSSFRVKCFREKKGPKTPLFLPSKVIHLGREDIFAILPYSGVSSCSAGYVRWN